jgi:hypothetical protein
MPNRMSDNLYSGSLKRKVAPTNVAARNLQDLLDPAIVSRGMVAPWGRDKQGVGQWAVPGIVAGAMKALDQTGEAMRLPPNTSPDHPAYKGVFDVAGAINMPALLRKGATSTVGMNLWHGGPNKWAAEPGFPQGRPRLDKMGEGEGNAAKGEGFYTAQEPIVAKEYRDVLSPLPATMTYGGKPIPGGVTISGATRRGTDFTPQEGMANNIYSEAISEGLDPTVVIQNKINSTLRRKNNLVERAKADGREGRSQHIVEVQNFDNHIALLQSIDPKLMKKAGPNDKVAEGQLYKIDIPDKDIAKYIDLDAPLSEQSQHIKGALKKIKDQLPENAFDDLGGNWDVMFGPNVTGEQLMGTIEDIMGGTGLAEKVLRKAGIPGNRYADQMSRGKYGVQLKYKGKDYTDGPVEFATKKQADDYLKESTKKGFEAEHIDIGTRNYVTWDQKVLDRTKVLQRNEEIYKQLEKSGVPFT